MSGEGSGAEDFEQPWSLAGEVRRHSYDIAQLREWKAAREMNDEHLTRNVDTLTRAVQELQTTIDRSRGALWVITGLSGTIGAAISALAMTFLHKPGP